MRLAMLAFGIIISFGSLYGAAQEKVYTHSFKGVAKNLDPAAVESYYSSVIATSLYDTLYSYKYLARPVEVKPNLAVALPEISKDGLQYTIKLKKGVRFIDDQAFKGGKGREVVAEDFAYSIKRHMDPKTRSVAPGEYDGIKGLREWKKTLDYNKPVEGLQVLDSHTIRIVLDKPDHRFLYKLTGITAGVVPREAVEKYGREFAHHPVGSGYFKLVSLDSTQAVLEKNPDYRKETFDLKGEGFDPKAHGAFGLEALNGRTLPMLDKLVVKFMKQSSSRWNSFTKGNEIQYATIPPDQAGQLLATIDPPTLKPELAEKYVFKPEREIGLVFSNFNFSDPNIGHNDDPVRNERNRKLRCAIRSAFDWNSQIKRFYYGLGEAYAGAISPDLPGYQKLDQESVTVNIKKAKQLLKDGGWNKKNLPVLSYGATSSVQLRQYFEQFRGFMKKIGYPRNKIKLKLAPTFSDFIKALNDGKYSYFGLGWVPSIPDPNQLMERYYGKKLPPGSNKAFYQNPEFDKLFDQAELMADGPERSAVFKKMNEILIHDCVGIESFSRQTLHVWHKDVLMDYTDIIVRNKFKYIDLAQPKHSH